MSINPVKADVTENATEEGVGFERKGYELHSENFISCPSCNKKLLSIIVVKKDCPCMIVGKDKKEINVLKVRAKCIKCNMLSFNQKFERCKIYYQAIPPLGITDVSVDELTGSVLVEVK
jgi:hypothetical protein